MTSGFQHITDFPGAKDCTHMRNTLLREHFQDLQAQFIAEVGSCSSSTGAGGKDRY